MFLVSSYTAPSQDNVELVLDTGYTAPDQDNVNLVLGDTGGVAASLGIDWIEPTANDNHTQYEFKEYTVQTCCFDANCGEINVSLDPTQTGDFNLSNGVNNNTALIGSAIHSGLCYQETANVSTACGGLSTGAYSWFNISCWTTPYNTADGDWGTSGYGATGACSGSDFMYVNYSKPSGATIDTLWEAKGDTHTNHTLPANCFDLTPLQLRIGSPNPAPTTFSKECYNGTDWQVLYSSDLGRTFFEEAMWWVIDNGSKGLINTTIGATPFYTNKSSNPINISLAQDECQNVTFWVNATGTVDTTHEFFANATLLSDTSISNGTSIIDITIVSGAVDACTYSGSGNFVLDATDNCTIDTLTNVYGDVYCNGVGYFFIEANLTTNEIYLDNNCSIKGNYDNSIYVG